jgi:hypothetical protein
VNTDQLIFRIPRAAADALPISEMAAQARSLGISPARVDVSTANAGRGHVRITCSTEMGIFLVEQFRELVAKASARKEPQLLIDASMAVASIFKAIEDAQRTGPTA